MVQDLGCGKCGFIFGAKDDFVSCLSFGEDYECLPPVLCAYDGIHFPVTEVFSCGYLFGTGIYASSVRRFFLGLSGFVLSLAFPFEEKVLCRDAREKALRDITIECGRADLGFYFGFVFGAEKVGNLVGTFLFIEYEAFNELHEIVVITYFERRAFGGNREICVLLCAVCGVSFGFGIVGVELVIIAVFQFFTDGGCREAEERCEGTDGEFMGVVKAFKLQTVFICHSSVISHICLLCSVV